MTTQLKASSEASWMLAYIHFEKHFIYISYIYVKQQTERRILPSL